jgi:dihydroflavonol-4-reductase
VLARPGSEVEPAGIDVRRGDVGDRGAVAAAVRGVRAVYHLAAATQKWARDPAVFERTNVAAAVALARSAAAAGAERIVHVSSFTVFGPAPPSAPVDERALASPERLQNDYQRSKHRAHVQLVAMAERGEAPIVLACPGVIYGKAPQRLRNPIADLVERLANGRLRAFPALDRAWTLAYAPDVAQGLRLLRARGRIGDSYLLGGPVATLREVAAWVERRTGARMPVTMPLWPLLGVGRAAELLACLRRSPTPPRLTAAALRFLRWSWAFSSAKAGALGYRSATLAAGLEDLWTDLHARNLVPNPRAAAVPAA